MLAYQACGMELNLQTGLLRKTCVTNKFIKLCIKTEVL